MFIFKRDDIWFLLNFTACFCTNIFIGGKMRAIPKCVLKSQRESYRRNRFMFHCSCVTIVIEDLLNRLWEKSGGAIFWLLHKCTNAHWTEIVSRLLYMRATNRKLMWVNNTEMYFASGNIQVFKCVLVGQVMTRCYVTLAEFSFSYIFTSVEFDKKLWKIEIFLIFNFKFNLFKIIEFFIKKFENNRILSKNFVTIFENSN